MLISIVIPLYNEGDGLPFLLRRLRAVLSKLDSDHEILFVNDGSRDATAELLLEAACSDPRIKFLEFSRNFGHQSAITAGLDYAQGDAVVIMDGDLQDPPELIPEMLRLREQGYEVVSAQRISRVEDTIFKRVSAGMFYFLMRKLVDPRLVPEVGDFRMFSRSAVLALRQFREQHRFMRGLVAWLGLKEVIVPFHRNGRAVGETKYPLWKMVCFAWTAISSFSALPLRVSLAFGMAGIVFGSGYLGYTLFRAFVEHKTAPGWTSLVCLQIIFASVLLVAIGSVGDYVARLYEQSKQRPLYVVATAVNIAVEKIPPRTVMVQTDIVCREHQIKR